MNLYDKTLTDIHNEIIAELTTNPKRLTERERSIIKLRFGINGPPERISVPIWNSKMSKEIYIEYDGIKKTLKEIGDMFNLTHERIRQIEIRVLRKLHHFYPSKFLPHKIRQIYYPLEEVDLIETLKNIN